MGQYGMMSTVASVGNLGTGNMPVLPGIPLSRVMYLAASVVMEVIQLLTVL
jgi:hypothetical protein